MSRSLLPLCLLLLSLCALGQQPDLLEAERLYQQAWLAETAEGDLESALSLYQRVLAEHLESPEVAGRAALRSGDCLERLQRHEAALRAYQQAIELLPGGPEAALASARLAALNKPEPVPLSAEGTWQIAVLPPGLEVEAANLTVLRRPLSSLRLQASVEAWLAQQQEPPTGVALQLFGDDEPSVAIFAELSRALQTHGCMLRSTLTRPLQELRAETWEDRRATVAPEEALLPKGSASVAPRVMSAGQPLFLLAGALERCLELSIDVDSEVAHRRAGFELATQRGTALDLLQFAAEAMDLVVHPTPEGYRLAPAGRRSPMQWVQPLPAFETPLGELAAAFQADVARPLADVPVTWLKLSTDARPELAATFGLELGLAGQRYLFTGTPPLARSYPRFETDASGCELYAYRDRLEDVVGALGGLVEVAPECADLPVSMWTRSERAEDILAKLVRFYPSLRLVQNGDWRRIELAEDFEPMPSAVDLELHQDGSFDLRCEEVPLFQLLEALDRLGPIDREDLWERPQRRHSALPSQTRIVVSLDLQNQTRERLSELLAQRGWDIDAQGAITIPDGPVIELGSHCELRLRSDGLYDVRIQQTPLAEVCQALAEIGYPCAVNLGLASIMVDFERTQLSAPQVLALLAEQLRLKVDAREICSFALPRGDTLQRQLNELRALDPDLQVVADEALLEHAISRLASENSHGLRSMPEALETLARLAQADVTETAGGFVLQRLASSLTVLVDSGLQLKCDDTPLAEVLDALRPLLADATLTIGPELRAWRIAELELKAADGLAMLRALAADQGFKLGRVGRQYRLSRAEQGQLSIEASGEGSFNIVAENTTLFELIPALLHLGTEESYSVRDENVGDLRVSVELYDVTAQEALNRIFEGYGLMPSQGPGGRLELSFAKLKVDAHELPLPELLAQLGLFDLWLSPGLEKLKVSVRGEFDNFREALAAAGLRFKAPDEPGSYAVQPLISLTVRPRARPGAARIIPLAEGGWALLLGCDATLVDTVGALERWSAESLADPGLVVDVFGASDMVDEALQASRILREHHASVLAPRSEIPARLGLPELVRSSRTHFSFERSQPMPACLWLGQLEAALSPRMMRYSSRAAEQPWAGGGQKDTPLTLLQELGEGAGLQVSCDAEQAQVETHAAAPSGWVDFSKSGLIAFDARLGDIAEALSSELGKIVLEGGLSDLRLSIVSRAQRSPSEHLDHIAAQLGLQQGLRSNLMLLEGPPGNRNDVRLLDESGLLSLFCFRQPLPHLLAQLAATRPELEISCGPQASGLQVTFYGERLSLEEIMERIAWMYGLRLDDASDGLHVTAPDALALDETLHEVLLDVRLREVALSSLAAILNAQAEQRFELEPDLELRIEALNLSRLTALEIATAAAEALQLDLEQRSDELYVFRRSVDLNPYCWPVNNDPAAEVLIRAYPDGRALESYRAGSWLVVELGLDALWQVPEINGLPVIVEVQPGVALNTLPGLLTQLSLAHPSEVRWVPPLRFRLAEGTPEQRLATLQGLSERLQQAGVLEPRIDPRGLSQAELQRLHGDAVPSDDSALLRALAGTRSAGFDAIEQAWQAGDLERLASLLRQTRHELVKQQLNYLELAAFHRLGDGHFELRSPLLSEDPAQLRGLLTRRGRLRVRGVLQSESTPLAYDELPGPDGKTLLLAREGSLEIEQALFARADEDGQGARIEVLLNDAGSARLAELSREYRGAQLAIVVDGRILSAPTVQDVIVGGRFWVTGQFELEEAERLAELFRQPLLPLEVTLED